MPSNEPCAQIRISLRDIEPEIWRRVEVPLGMKLQGLHDVIQAVIGWEGYHLFEFRIGGKLYGIPAPSEEPGRKVSRAKSVKLASLVAKDVKCFENIYDFGDDWQFTIEIESIGETDPKLWYPRFVGGARREPPEDVGGFPGYHDFVDAVTDPRNPEHQVVVEWYGGPYDPDDPDLPAIRDRLGLISQRRQAGRAGYAKSATRRGDTAG